jgi:hypothetical protein
MVAAGFARRRATGARCDGEMRPTMYELSASPAVYAALLLAPTVGGGHDADLKFEDERYRIWVTRATDADWDDYGLPPQPVQIEVYDDREGRWRFGIAADLPYVIDAARRAGLRI